MSYILRRTSQPLTSSLRLLLASNHIGTDTCAHRWAAENASILEKYSCRTFHPWQVSTPAWLCRTQITQEAFNSAMSIKISPKLYPAAQSGQVFKRWTLIRYLPKRIASISVLELTFLVLILSSITGLNYSFYWRSSPQLQFDLVAHKH